MTNESKRLEISEEQAVKIIIRFSVSLEHGQYPNYGYDLYLPNVIRAYLESLGMYESESDIKEFSPSFYAAAWTLCLKGILRPGISHYGGQVTHEGSAGGGYSFTPTGKEWIIEQARQPRHNLTW